VKSLSSQVQPERRPRIIKANAANTVVARQAVMDKFESSTIQVAQSPAQVKEMEHQRGYDAGYQEGLTRAHADVVAATDDASRRVRNALAALSEAVASFDQRQTVALGDVEDAIVAGAFALARSVLQRELIIATDPGGDALARALQLVPDRGDVTARMHPDDIATLNMDRITNAARTVLLVADLSIELGGCVLEVGQMRIDAQLSSALEHAARAMSVDTALVEVEEPLVDEDVAAARMEAAMNALQEASIAHKDLPEDAVIEGTEAQSVTAASDSKNAVAGRSRKSSRKTASEAPNK
jgi:flagellar assembly protein FliH